MTDPPATPVVTPDPADSTQVPTARPVRPVDWIKIVVLGVVFYVIFAVLGSLVRFPTTLTSVIGLFLATLLAGRIVGWHGTARWILAAVLIFVVTALISIGLLLLVAPEVLRPSGA